MPPATGESEARARLKKYGRALAKEFAEDGSRSMDDDDDDDDTRSVASSLSSRSLGGKKVRGGRRRSGGASAGSGVAAVREMTIREPEEDLCRAYAWGAVNWGTLETSKRNNPAQPRQLKLAGSWRQLACGEAGFVAVDENGRATALGVYQTPNKQVRCSEGVADVSVSGDASFGAYSVGDSGAVYRYQGNNGVIEWERPLRFLSKQKILKIACGARHAVAVSVDGQLFSWGEASAGQLGQGDEDLTKPRPHPAGLACNGQSTFEAVSCGTHHSAAVDTDGFLWTWGWSEHGRLGRGPPDGLSMEDMEDGAALGTPGICDDAEAAFEGVACGSAHTIAFSRDSVFGCGWNEFGQACGFLSPKGAKRLTRVRFARSASRAVAATTRPLTSHFVALAAGFAHSLALDAEGRIRAWGFGEEGQLGSGSERSSAMPTDVQEEAGGDDCWKYAFVAAAGGFSAAVCLKGDETSRARQLAIARARRRLGGWLRVVLGLNVFRKRRARAAVVVQRRWIKEQHQRDARATAALRAATHLAVERRDPTPLLKLSELIEDALLLLRRGSSVTIARRAKEAIRRLKVRASQAAKLKNASLSMLPVIIRETDACVDCDVDVLLLGPDEEGEDWRERFDELREAKRVLQEGTREGAASTLEKFARKCQAIKRRKRLQTAAGRLSSSMRGLLDAKRERRRSTDEIELLQRQKRCAALKIQSMCRGQKQRSLFRTAMKKRRKREAEERARAAKLLRLKEQEEEEEEENARLLRVKPPAPERRPSLKESVKDREEREARLAVREAARVAKEALKADAAAAAMAVSEAQAELLKAKLLRDRQRNAKLAAQRRSAASPAPPPPPEEEEEEAPMLMSSKSAPSFPEHVDSLYENAQKQQPTRRRSSSSRLPLAEQGPAPTINKKGKSKFKTVDQWATATEESNNRH